MSDPLADVIQPHGCCQYRRCAEEAATAVRAHLAAVLDAEEAKWREQLTRRGHAAPVFSPFDGIRSALGVAPTARRATQEDYVIEGQAGDVDVRAPTARKAAEE